MKNLITIFLLVFISLIVISSCKKDDGVVVDTSPKAIIISKTSATPKDTVYLDGSTSLNALAYAWSGTTPSSGSIEFYETGNPSNKSNAVNKVFFIANELGVYNITLEVTNESETSEAQAQVNVSGAIEIGGTLIKNETLSNINSNSDSCDYFLSADLNIPEGLELTIEDGVTICVAEDVAIKARGILTCNGTVKIKAHNKNWRGIHVMNTSTSISNLTIEGAGSRSFTSNPEEKAGMYVENDILKLGNCSFINNNGYGLVVEKGVTIGDYYSNFENNSSGPAILSLETFAAHAQNNSFGSTSANTYLRIRGGSRTSSTNFPKLAIPYLMLGDTDIKGTFTIQAGATIKMSDTSGIKCLNLKSIGSSSEPILIEGITKTAGSWKGINCGQADLNYTTIKYAGSAPLNAYYHPSFTYTTALMIEGGSSTKIQNSTIVNNMGYGVVTYSYYNIFDMNNISNNSNGAIVTSTSSMAKMNSNNSTYSGYGKKPILTVHSESTAQLSGSVIGNPNWRKISADTASTDYKLMKGDYSTQGGTWTISQGVLIECDANVAMTIGNNGTLDAQGISSKKVTFKGSTGTAGSWKGIYASSGSTIKLDNVEINHGGGSNGNFQGCLNVSNTVSVISSFVRNCSFRNGGSFDLYFTFGTDPLNIKSPGNNNSYNTSN